jgi:hypothetical protein
MPLIADGVSDLPARQRTLEAAIRWSSDLLTAEQRAALFGLSVFADSWTADTATRVVFSDDPARQPDADAQIAAWNTLSALLDAGLIQRVAMPDAAREPRFRLLQTIRAYAHAESARAGDAGKIAARNTAHWARFAEACHREYLDQHDIASLWIMHEEMPNIIPAAQHAVGHGLAETACATAAAGVDVWRNFGFWKEGLAIAEAALALPPVESAGYRRARAGALLTVVRLKSYGAEALMAMCEEADALFASAGDEDGLWRAAIQRVWTLQQNDIAEALVEQRMLVARARAGNDKHRLGHRLCDFGVQQIYNTDESEDAVRNLREGIRLYQETGETLLRATCVAILGEALARTGQIEKAIALLTREVAESASLPVLQQLDLEGCLANVLAVANQLERSREYYTHSVALALQRGAPDVYYRELLELGLVNALLESDTTAEEILRRVMAHYERNGEQATHYQRSFANRCRIGLATTAARTERREEAEALFAQVEAYAATRDVWMNPFEMRLHAETRRLLGR